MALLASGSWLLTSCSKPRAAQPSTESSTASAELLPASSTTSRLETAQASPAHVTQVTMHNVILIERPGFQLRVRWLRGQMHPTRRDVVPSFDQPASFVLNIQDGVVATKLAEISDTLNGGMLRGTPLSKVSLTAQGQQLKLAGTLHKGIPLPVEMISDLSAAPDGRIKLHVVKTRVLKLPVTGLLQSFHVKVGDLVGAKGAPGVQVIDDDLYIDPERMLPAPAIRGKLSDVHIGHKSGDLITVYGNARNEVAQVRQWRNFIRMLGGVVNFGKLTMTHTDLFLIDASDDEWFTFDLANYQEQLVNGNLQMTPEAGLRVFMPDIDKLPRTTANNRINLQWMKNRNLPPPADVVH
jgi:hypothetical protein